MLVTLVSIADQAKGTDRKGFAILKTNALSATPQGAPNFTRDGLAVVYPIGDDNNVDNLWMQPLESKLGRQIRQFTADEIFAFGWSPDAKQLMVGRGHVESDAVLLRDTSK